jgi:hypothetical protein
MIKRDEQTNDRRAFGFMNYVGLAIEVPQQLAPLDIGQVLFFKPLSAAARASLRFEFECRPKSREGSPATLRETASA